MEFTEDLHDSARGGKRKRLKNNGDQMAPEKAINAKQKRGTELAQKKIKAKSSSGKWCEYHQTTSHDTSECKVVLAQACRMRQAWDNKSESSKRDKRSNKKQEQLNALVAKQVKLLLKRACAAKIKEDEEENLNVINTLKEFELLDLDKADLNTLEKLDKFKLLNLDDSE